MHRFAIIVAGGSGSRMDSKVPKQFLELNGLPILMHTINQFDKVEGISIIVVLPEDQHIAWKRLCLEHDFFTECKVVNGGETRFHSVRNGLDAIYDEESLVAIHDGVRPMVRPESIEESFEVARKNGSAITAVPMKDSLRKSDKGKSRTVNRDEYWMIQTPQTFKVELIKKAYETEYVPDFTDDASVLEASGKNIHLISGDYKNIKITTPEDLVVAEAFLKQ